MALVLLLLRIGASNEKSELCTSTDFACFSKQLTSQLLKPCKRRVAVALAGAGTFARKAHCPSLVLDDKDCFDLRAVWSKSASSAQALSELVVRHGGAPPVPLWGDQGWREILSGELKLELVDVVLPISVQPSFVTSALAVGLAVVSEKPAAANVSQAEDMLESLESHNRFNAWFVSENWRFEPAFRVAQLAISAGAIGQIIAFSASSVTYMPDDLPYMNLQSWRMQEDSNWIVDVAVHFAAALHLVLGSLEIEGVVIRRVRPKILPFDTFAASLRAGSLDNQIPGAWLFSLSAPRPAPAEISGLSDLDLRLSGTNGTLCVSRAKVELRDMSGRLVQNITGLAGPSVAYALRDVAHSILEMQPAVDTSPRAALRDLRLVESLERHAGHGSGSARRPSFQHSEL